MNILVMPIRDRSIVLTGSQKPDPFNWKRPVEWLLRYGVSEARVGSAHQERPNTASVSVKRVSWIISGKNTRSWMCMVGFVFKPGWAQGRGNESVWVTKQPKDVRTCPASAVRNKPNFQQDYYPRLGFMWSRFIRSGGGILFWLSCGSAACLSEKFIESTFRWITALGSCWTGQGGSASSRYRSSGLRGAWPNLGTYWLSQRSAVNMGRLYWAGALTQEPG